MKPAFDDSFIRDFLEDDLELAIEENFDTKKEIAAIMLDYFSQNESKKIVAPDTSGVDYFFLSDFINENMKMDFALIEQDFLDKCRGRLQEFNDAMTLWDSGYRLVSPLDSMHKKIIALIYSGAKLGDEYCVALMVYLFKTYHKREYNSLKRFQKITTQEIFGLSEDEFGECDYTIIGRIMGMCPFMHIEYHNNCAVLFKLLLNRRDEWMAEDEKALSSREIDHELFTECKAQVDAWVDEAGKNKPPAARIYKHYWEIGDFVGDCLRNRGFDEHYVYNCIENSKGLRLQMTRTLAVLKSAHPNRTYTFEQVQELTNIYDLVTALTQVADWVEFEVGYLTGDRVDPFDIEDAWFKPEAISVRKSAKKEDKKTIPNVAPVSNGDISEDDYIGEIEELRKKLHEKEQENQYLRDQYRAAKRSASESEGLISKYEEERDELIALREFVYKTEHEEDEPVTQDRLPQMKEFIAKKNIVIIGGHINWQNKLKELFPGWKYVSTGAYKTVDGAMLENKDRVYFYTDYISHVSYYKFIAAVRERKIPFGYIGSYNVDRVIRQVYEDLK